MLQILEVKQTMKKGKVLQILLKLESEIDVDVVCRLVIPFRQFTLVSIVFDYFYFGPCQFSSQATLILHLIKHVDK